MKKILLLFAFIYIGTDLFPQTFTKKVLLDNYYGREAEWGDFDGDGDLDILMFYTLGDPYGKSYTRIIENKIDTFTELEVGLPKVENFGASRNGSLNWIDYNNDGLLDIFLIKGESFSAKMKIYKNNGNKTFTDIKCDSILSIIPGSCGPSFADYDNDGDLDFLLMGNNFTPCPFTTETKIYENLGNGKFVDSGIKNITGVIKSRMPWGDFNNDGYIDILANEPNQNGTSNIVVYKNNGNKTFAKIVFNNLSGLNNDYLNQAGDMRWGDYNNDGYIDILLSGAHTSSNSVGITRIYKNNGDETITDTGINNIYGMAMDVSVEWGDYNNDGVLDLLQTGDGWINGVEAKTRIFFNNNGIYEKEPNDLFLGVHQRGMSTAADYDNDGDLDILVLGDSVNFMHPQIALYNNYQNLKNTKPEIPTNLQTEVKSNEIILKWDRSNDDETPSKGLSYNVCLISGNNKIIAPNALQTGKRTIVGMGNAQQNNFLKINNLATGHYKWRVQSIDNCFEGSEFSNENAFEYINYGILGKENDNSSLVAYPNPFNDFLKIDISNFGNNRCSIYISDLMGRKLININEISLPYIINTSSLKVGLYLLNIIQKNSILIKKIEKK